MRTCVQAESNSELIVRGERREKKSKDAIPRSEMWRSSNAKILREGRWRCNTRVWKDVPGRTWNNYQVNHQNSRCNFVYWILYCTAVKDQTPDKLKQNVTKNPVQHLISNIRKYSIEANKIEWVCAAANTVLRSGCIETRIPARMSWSTSKTAKSRRKQKGQLRDSVTR